MILVATLALASCTSSTGSGTVGSLFPSTSVPYTPSPASPYPGASVSPGAALPIAFDMREVLQEDTTGIDLRGVPFTKGVIAPNDPYRSSPDFKESSAISSDRLVTFRDQDGDGFYSPGTDVKYELGPALIGLADLKHAESSLEPAQFGQTAYWAVLLTFTTSGRAKFATVTTSLVGHELAIVVGEIVVVAPTVQVPITGGAAQITNLNEEGATTLATELNASIP